jgi:formylglycine-generating enzyme required for sulfatase activity
MKQIYLSIFLLILLTCSGGQGTESKFQKKPAKVTEPQGLVLRDAPSIKGKQLALMRDGEEVMVLRDDGPEETLFGRKSRWFEVDYKGMNGFAFGGFLEYKGKQVTSKNQSIDKGKGFKNSIGMEFALIPSGEFLMGCSHGDIDCNENELPQHKVKITKSFYMGVFEVTQGQWEKVMRNNPSYFSKCGLDCPVESVSWDDTQVFIQKLCKMENLNPCTYRLPTEAEWEYSARAGTSTKYYWGESLDESYLWYKKNSGKQTHPVGKKKPNLFGLYDMIGNIDEWVQDWYEEKYYAKSPSNDPKGFESGGSHLFRGGSWDSIESRSRVSARIGLTGFKLDFKAYGIGFRLIKTE